jgi:Xaa-Pro aminopeptidase
MSTPDVNGEAVNRDNVHRVQKHMREGGLNALVLTDVWSFLPLVGVPIFDLEVPRIVIVPAEGEPRLLAPHWGRRTVVETTWVDEENVVEFAPYSQYASGDRSAPDFDDALTAALESIETGSVGVDLQRTSYQAYHEVAEAVDGSPVDAEPVLEAVLGTKTAAEFELVEEGVRVAEAGVDAALDAIEPGATEFEVAAAAESVMRARGDRLFPFDYHYAAGPHSLQPARRVSDRKLREGETFNVDVLPLVNNYFADICRCAIVGDVEPTDEQRALYETVLASHDVIYDTVAEGVPVAELDRALREFFAERGYDGKFVHHSGHGVGTVFGPDIVPNSDAVFERNHVVAIEPGLYVDGVGGVRIEDVFRVTATGVESLMEYPKDLL